ncbi:MAG: hypothetical protein AVDCRST_MAG18-4358 [uncultured Thermomicrobiales bacterium]|uniref:Fido domain-containing protein n=1 Tax=uncultured Thermomicrobiales bacterium TaxID=1645740 RepID=A0A6J4VT59_9BACT|nr:MAG: hypothetical protein AVDCRST_MAG18-4358 [uncultured Thermomicrobiales bacterium]
MTTLDAEIRYYTAEEVAAFHGGVMESAPMNPSDAVRDWNLLESAINRPHAVAHYQGADLVGQAATLLWGLVENHPFHDGNKRTAWVAAEAFLNANGVEVTASDDEAFEVIVAVAQGLSVDATEAWLRERVAAMG